MDKFEKKYNWNEWKDQLPEHEPKDSLWDSITTSLDTPDPLYDFSKLKDDLPSYTPDSKVWSGINSELELPDAKFDFNQLKDKLPTHTPDDKIWDDISKTLDTPRPLYDFHQIKDKLPEYSPTPALWDGVEDGLELNSRIDQLPSHEPPVGIWDKIEEDLEDVKGGISFIRSAIMLGISMLILIGVALMLNQEEKQPAQIIESSTMMFASNEKFDIQWSDDEDVRLIQEMCQDYMAVCEQPKFKELETELLELNDHKKELLELVSEFDEESSYGPMLVKIENQKTALMKEMIAMI